jgi:hypothetical protein
MDPNYRASEQQWRFIEDEASRAGFSSSSCLLELRARIEALEAAQQPADQVRGATEMVAPATEESSATAPPAPAGGLVERLKLIIAETVAGETCGEVEPELWDSEARAVIREVAATALEMASDKNLTWERVALWLDREALQ